MGVLYGFVAVLSTTLLLLLNSGLVDSNLQCRKQSSICKPTTQCPEIFERLSFISDPPFCDSENKKVCCPLPAINIPLDSKNPWALACKEYQNLLGDVKETNYIVDGKEAEPKEFPFMALLGYRNETNQTEWKCGGTLITPSWVLTATHCINQLKNDILVVRLGELDYDTADNNMQEFDRVTVIAYSTFEDNRHDIALIRLGRNATLNPYVLPACMPTTNAVNYDYYLVAGWGKTSKHGAPSNQLLKTKIYQNPNCSVFFDQSLNNKICAGSIKDHADTCSGDSGGPLFVPHSSIRGMYQVLGITSYGLADGCGSVEDDIHYPSFYTNVYSYIEWINFHLQI